MVKPYIVKFVSSRSRVGKTSVASYVVSKLKSRGYSVGVVKHCVHGVDVEDKDTHKYIASNADIVIASSKNLGIVYHRVWIDSLDNILNFISTPIVIVEGFKGSRLGDTVVIAKDLYEVQHTENEQNIIAYIVRNINKNPGDVSVPILTFNDIDKLVDMIEERVINYIYSQLPKNNCRQCGFSSCRDFAIAFAKGLARECGVKLDVKLVIDDKNIELNPFVKRLIKSVVIGIVEALKGVPRSRKRILIEIEEDFFG